MSDLESDKIFLEELKKGYKYQAYVNQYFKNAGFETIFDELKIRKNKNEINKFTDDGDLTIISKNHKIRTEIKSRNLSFDGVDDFPYETILVDRVNTWKRKMEKKTKPHAVIIISQITYDMFVIPVSSEKNWIIESKHDNLRDYDREYYLCKREDLKSIEEFINYLNS